MLCPNAAERKACTILTEGDPDLRSRLSISDVLSGRGVTPLDEDLLVPERGEEISKLPVWIPAHKTVVSAT